MLATAGILGVLKIAAIAGVCDFTTSSITYHFWDAQKGKSKKIKVTIPPAYKKRG